MFNLHPDQILMITRDVHLRSYACPIFFWLSEYNVGSSPQWNKLFENKKYGEF